MFIAFATVWTGLQLVLALLLSIPPVNTLLHGTHAVMAHAMGSMIGIDSMILWAFFAFMSEREGGEGNPLAVWGPAVAVNVFLLLLWTTLLVSGGGRGVEVYTGAAAGNVIKAMRLQDQIKKKKAEK